MASVRAVFLPRNATAVQFSDGEWLLEDEVSSGLKQRLSIATQPLYGIAFVPENAPSMLYVSAGMTAAESSQYYPPLPGDPSYNHYNPWPTSGAVPGAVGSVLGAVPQRSCASSDVPIISMQACSSMDPLWELERAKAMSAGYVHLQELPTSSQSLVDPCTVSHVGLAPRILLESESRATSCAAIQPFPTDDL